MSEDLPGACPRRTRRVDKDTTDTFLRFLCFLLFIGILVPTAAHGAGDVQPKTDLTATFANPPPGYGPVVAWWLAGERLDRERLTWQLEQFKSEGIDSVSVSYPIDARKIPILGDPPFFSDAWWDEWRFLISECERLGMTIAMLDYPYIEPALKALVAKHPELGGWRLTYTSEDVAGGSPTSINVPPTAESVMAYRITGGQIDPKSQVDVREHISGDQLKWTPHAGTWRVVVVYPEPAGRNLMLPGFGQKLVEDLYAEFERRCPGHAGKTFIGWHQDELQPGVVPPMWSPTFADEFQRRKGYDMTPWLPALWHDIGPRVSKFRVDYYDVAVSLMEENYYRPIYEYCQQHGLAHSNNQWGRHSIQRATAAYLDFFRTMRWYDAPGFDSDWNHKGAKLASSIAGFYQRPRVWYCAFVYTGWGSSLSERIGWINKNYTFGANQLNDNSAYYTTYGSWYEWAPPSGHFRQPYWSYYDRMAIYAARLSYLLSRGVHRCDVAILYPTATMHAALDAGQTYPKEILQPVTVRHAAYPQLDFSDEAATCEETTWDLARHLFVENIDFAYIDHESIARATIKNGEFCVGEHRFRTFILPSVTTVRWQTIEKALEFYRLGGMVISYGTLPRATDRIGAEDARLDEILREIFGLNAAQAVASKSASIQRNSAGGIGAFVPKDYAKVQELIDKNIAPDFATEDGKLFVHHRSIEGREFYFLYNTQEHSVECDAVFRGQGNPELWNPWDGTVRPIAHFRPKATGTRMKLKLGPHEAQLISFRPGLRSSSIAQHDRNPAAAAVRPAPMVLDGTWEIELVPTLDNRWGDFRLPASDTFIGAEARRFRFAAETEASSNWHTTDFDDSAWPEVTHSFAPYFWKLGPIPPGSDVEQLESQLSNAQSIDPRATYPWGESQVAWSPYFFSKRWGIENDPIQMQRGTGPHGLKQVVPDEFFDLGDEPPGTIFYLWTSVPCNENAERTLKLKSSGPCAAWLNGQRVLTDSGDKTIHLQSGSNPLLLKLVRAEEGPLFNYTLQRIGLRAYAVVGPREYSQASIAEKQLGLRWFLEENNAETFDAHPEQTNRVGWYRFAVPPGTHSMDMKVFGSPQIWVDGKEATVTSQEPLAGEARRCQVQFEPSATTAAVAIRIKLSPHVDSGAAIPEPISLACVPGKAELGNWCDLGLSTYSGKAWYRRNFTLTPDQAGGPATLDLSDVAETAEVRVNGKAAGVRIAPPWRFEISHLVRPGDNSLEVLVSNTLANHYSVGIPTQYVYEDQTVSGLLGPVKIEFEPNP